MCFLILYLGENKPEKEILARAQKISIKAWSNGYLLLAYEAAYVLKQWSDEPERGILYEKIAAHQPS